MSLLGAIRRTARAPEYVVRHTFPLALLPYERYERVSERGAIGPGERPDAAARAYAGRAAC